jgi:signal transduction histidine kinase
MENEVIPFIPRQFTLDEWNEREYELAEKAEELESQKEELNAAIEELNSKNEYLSKTLEELSQRKDELDQLIYRMSHDLRTPVTSILGVCHIMKLEGLPAAFYFHLDHIQKKGYEMNALLKSLSSFSQVAFEPLQRDSISLQKVLTDVIDSLRLEKDFSSVQFALVCDSETYFYSDKNKLFLLMRNVIKNALDFRATDRVCEVAVTLQVIGSQLHFYCKDNGIGIEESIQSKIFNMFYRGSDRSTGSGLGLYVVNEIMRRLKGSVHLESTPGETSFFVSIPELKVEDL